MFNHTLSAILRGAWLISQEAAESYLPLVTSILTGANFNPQLNGNETLTGSGETEDPYIIDASGKRVNVWYYTREKGLHINTSLITPGSVGVVPFIGPVMKYNGGCGEPGIIKRTGWAAELANHPNIVAVINWIDSPGGQADGTPQYADFIKSIQKPTVAFISGGAYSAGAWVASGHDLIYCADKHCGFGSIGAYTTLANFDGYYEKAGIKIKTVYPDVSKDKNKGYRDIFEKNDDTLIKEDIANLALSFREAFAENRAGKLKNDSWNTGKVFTAQESLEIGLIDGILSFQELVSSLQKGQIIKATPSSPINNPNNMKFENLTALVGVDAPTTEKIDLANADLTEAGITKVTLVEESFITEAAQVTTDLAAANASIVELTTAKTTAETALATANAAIATNATTIADLSAKVEAFGKNAGSIHTLKPGEDTPPGDAEDTATILAGLAHNRAADKTLNS